MVASGGPITNAQGKGGDIFMANRFVLNETSYHGAGAIAEIATEAVGRGFAKALVCSDPDLIKFGVTKKVTDVLDGAGLAYEIYSNIKPNPTIENVQQGVAAFKAAEADYIIAIGGGTYARALKCGVAFGPAIGEEADSIHQPNEYVTLSTLDVMFDVYKDALYELCIK